MSDFLKSATTKVPAGNSQNEIIRVLTRYGASGFGFRTRRDIVEVTFHLPRKDADDMTVCVPIDISMVKQKLVAWHASPARKSRTGPPDRAQAERTAWRALVIWIEAALLAVSVGAQSLEEAFFAHLVVETNDGTQTRMVEYIGQLSVTSGGRLPASSPRALPASTVEGKG